VVLTHPIVVGVERRFEHLTDVSAEGREGRKVPVQTSSGKSYQDPCRLLPSELSQCEKITPARCQAGAALSTVDPVAGQSTSMLDEPNANAQSSGVHLLTITCAPAVRPTIESAGTWFFDGR
jgi:hypothetical protein